MSSTTKPEESKQEDAEVEPMMASENEPPKKKALKKSWERELVVKLGVTWKDAVTLIRLAKKDLEIPIKSNPEDQKEAVFERATEIADSDEFERSPKPGEKTSEENEGFDDGKLIAAFVVEALTRAASESQFDSHRNA